MISVQCSECPSGEKTGAGKPQEPSISTSVDVAVWLESTMNRVSDGDRSTSLSFLSCGALQSDEIIGTLKVLFRYVGIGTRLATCSVNWMEAREFATRSLLRRGWASFCDMYQHTSSRPSFAGLSVAPWNKDDISDGVPTDQLSHNHCDCTDSHCNSHIVTSCVFVLVLHSHHNSIGGRLLLLPQAARDGLALCHLSRQDTSRGVPSQGKHRSKVCACRR